MVCSVIPLSIEYWFHFVLRIGSCSDPSVSLLHTADSNCIASSPRSLSDMAYQMFIHSFSPDQVLFKKCILVFGIYFSLDYSSAFIFTSLGRLVLAF